MPEAKRSSATKDLGEAPGKILSGMRNAGSKSGKIWLGTPIAGG